MNKKYNIIYLDPAWKFNARNNTNTKFGGGTTNKYPTMSLEEIKQLDIPSLADDNCAIFMWCTTSTGDSNLAQKLQLFEHWGFRLVNHAFTWVKLNPKSYTPYFGTGYYTKANIENCYLGIKGKMKPVSNSVSSLVIAPREEHSKKPDIIRNKIVELFGDLPRCELFARQQVDGWDCYGNQLKNSYDLRDLGKDFGSEKEQY